MKVVEKLSIPTDGLQGYIVQGYPKTQSPDTVILTGLQRFHNSNKNEYSYFLVFPVREILNNKLSIIKTPHEETCSICNESTTNDVNRKYKTQSNLQECITVGNSFKLPKHSKTYTLQICKHCHNAIVNEVQHQLPSNYLVSYTV